MSYRVKKGGENIAYVKKTGNPRMGRPSISPITHNLKVILDDDTYQKLEALCEKTGKTKSEAARIILGKFLKDK